MNIVEWRVCFPPPSWHARFQSRRSVPTAPGLYYFGADAALRPLRLRFAKPAPDTYLPGMPITRKPLEIPPEVARSFEVYMRAFHAEQDPLKRDGIAADTRHALLQHMPKGTKLRLADVIELFRLMR